MSLNRQDQRARKWWRYARACQKIGGVPSSWRSPPATQRERAEWVRRTG